MDLNRILKFFESKIGTTLSEKDVFLIKYDLKSNSVFDKKDFEALKKDLIQFSQIDFNTDNLFFKRC